MAVFQSTRPMRGATSWTFKDVDTAEQFQSTRPMRGATSSHTRRTYKQLEFQSTRPMRGATNPCISSARRLHISIHAPHAGRDDELLAVAEIVGLISIHAPHAGRDADSQAVDFINIISIHAPHAGRDGIGNCCARQIDFISIHAPHAGRDDDAFSNVPATNVFQSTRPMRGATRRSDRLQREPAISIHAPHAGRDHEFDSSQRTEQADFNPRAPCGARPAATFRPSTALPFQSTRPMRGATPDHRDQWLHHLISIHAPHAGRDGDRFSDYGKTYISIHAPHAGRDSKSIQNYFTHFCDKRQFLDNFTQNAVFQSVLPLAGRQKLLYLRCEPLRKFLRAFASHYKIIGSSGR